LINQSTDTVILLLHRTDIKCDCVQHIWCRTGTSVRLL